MIERIVVEPPIRFGDLSLWQHLGAVSLLLWLPPLLLPLSEGRRYAVYVRDGGAGDALFSADRAAGAVCPADRLVSRCSAMCTYVYFWFRDTQLEFRDAGAAAGLRLDDCGRRCAGCLARAFESPQRNRLTVRAGARIDGDLLGLRAERFGILREMRAGREIDQHIDHA